MEFIELPIFKQWRFMLLNRFFYGEKKFSGENLVEWFEDIGLEHARFGSPSKFLVLFFVICESVSLIVNIWR